MSASQRARFAKHGRCQKKRDARTCAHGKNFSDDTVQCERCNTESPELNESVQSRESIVKTDSDGIAETDSPLSLPNSQPEIRREAPRISEPERKPLNLSLLFRCYKCGERKSLIDPLPQFRTWCFRL